MRLKFRQDERTWSLGTVDADAVPNSYGFDLQVAVPPEATPGPATLVADGSSDPTEAEFTVVALPDTGGQAIFPGIEEPVADRP